MNTENIIKFFLHEHREKKRDNKREDENMDNIDSKNRMNYILWQRS